MTKIINMPDIGEQVYVAADLQSGAFRCGGAFSLTTSRQFEVVAWCISEPLLESLREMRPVLESYHISDILRRCGIFEQQSPGFFQSVLHNVRYVHISPFVETKICVNLLKSGGTCIDNCSGETGGTEPEE